MTFSIIFNYFLQLFSMYFIGVSGLRVLPLLINGWMDGLRKDRLTVGPIQWVY